MKTSIRLLGLGLLLGLLLPDGAQAQFTFTTNAENTLTLTGYTGTNPVLTIPDSTNGMKFTSIGTNAFKNKTSLMSVAISDCITWIGSDAFSGCTSLTNLTIGNGVTNIGRAAFSPLTSLTNVTIPASVSSIGDNAFYHNPRLKNVFFRGNAPSLGSSVFEGFNTLYYFAGAIGWTNLIAGKLPVLWNPQAQTNAASFGIRTNRFGFTITGTTDIPIVVEACTNLSGGTWTPVQTCTITNGSIYFSDPQWTNHPARLYRLRSP